MAAKSTNGVPLTVMVDKTIMTPKGEVRIYLDAETMRENVDNYYDKLRSARRIPFDLSDMSPLDPAIVEASAKYDYMEPAQVLETVRQHYEVIGRKALKDAWIIAATKETKNLRFEPDPYAPPEAPTDDWDIHLSEPEINLLNPVERRLKQIMDMFTAQDDPTIVIELQNTFTQFGIMMERRLREVDEDGFPSGRSDRNLSPQTRTVSLVKATPKRRPGVAGLPGGDGNTGHEEGGSAPTEDGDSISGTDIGEELSKK